MSYRILGAVLAVMVALVVATCAFPVWVGPK